MDEQNPYYLGTTEKKKLSNLAIASIVLGVLSLILFFNPILAVISIILGIIALCKKHNGKFLSISGIVTSSITLIAFTIFLIELFPFLVMLPEFFDDMEEIYINYDVVINEFDATGELPDYMDKYFEDEVGEIFDENFGGFDEFFNEYLRLENIT